MTDAHRKGDAHLNIDGERRPLRLTLGALAEIEEELGEGGFDALAARLSRPSAGDILFLLHALLRGGGAELSLAALKASGVDLAEASRAIAAAFAELNLGEQSAPGKPRAPAETTVSPGATGSSSP